MILYPVKQDLLTEVLMQLSRWTNWTELSLVLPLCPRQPQSPE
jgi:hypothetical protein